jgi:hypothetical protein
MRTCEYKPLCGFSIGIYKSAKKWLLVTQLKGYNRFFE